MKEKIIIANLKAILFDLDDTLFDRNKAQRKILHLITQEFQNIFTGIDEERIVKAFFESDIMAREEFKISRSRDVVRIGRSKRFLKALGLSEDSVDKITAKYVNSYTIVNTPIKDAKSIVEKLAKKFQLGIVSNGYSDVQYQKLKTIGIKHLFNCIILFECFWHIEFWIIIH